MLSYKQLKFLGSWDICIGKGTISVWDWKKWGYGGKVVIGSRVADTGLCREDCLPLARCC